MNPEHGAGGWDWLLDEQSGVLTTAQAAGLLGTGAVRTRLQRGVWRRICRGILLTSNGGLTRDQQLWVAVLVAGRDGLLAGAAAAQAGGVRGLRTDPLHVLVPAERAASTRVPHLPIDMPAVRLRRTAILPPQHRQVGRPPRTAVARSIVDAAAWARSDNEARLVLAAACQQRRVLPSQLLDVVAVMPRVRRRRLIRTTLADITGGAHALGEIDLLAMCRRFKLPLPDQQTRRVDADGRNRYLDAYWNRWRLQIEVDGAHHMDAEHWAADMLRQNQIWISGDRILRFPAWFIRERPAEVARQVRAALVAAGWPVGDRGESTLMARANG